MRLEINRLREQHRAIEPWLDRLQASLPDSAGIGQPFAEAFRLAMDHYEQEARFFATVPDGFSVLAAKLTGQHEEACEVGSALQSLLSSPNESGREPDSPDVIRLARRFHAIAQHNIIEEERDLFRLLESLC